ncbi:MAG: GerMN domain-containing protein [Candidatus Poribacteria bacterium]
MFKKKGYNIVNSGIALMSLIMIVIMSMAINNMTAQDTDEVTKDTPDENSIEIKLYFLDPDGNNLIPEKRYISQYGNITDHIKLALLELSRGPQTGLIPTVPQGIDIREVFVDEKRCAYIDLGRSIMQNHNGGTTGELLTISSIVKTLAESFPKNIHKVRFLIDGREARTIAGHVDISKPIFP